MTIPITLGLLIVYVVLSNLKFAQQRDPDFRARQARREEIRERHARNRRRRALRAQRKEEAVEECCATIDATKRSEEGTQEDAASSCCA